MAKTGVQLDITWSGRSAADFSRVFMVAAGVHDFKEAFEQIASEVIAPSVKKNFDRGGRPPWQDLSEATVASKSRQGVSNPSRILVHTQALANAASDVSRYQISKDMLRAAPFGVNYWIYHQDGTVEMPQRVIMMLQADDRTAINKIFSDFMRKFLVFTGVGARPFKGVG